jgi:excisionase family DNA binding protein
MTARAGEPAGEVISARATVTLDARALDELGPATIDRLADLVASRLAERRAAGEAPLLTVAQAAEVAGVHPCTVRRAIHLGALEAAGYVGKRPRLRREEVDRWLYESGGSARASTSSGTPARPTRRLARSTRPRVLGEALAAALNERERS